MSVGRRVPWEALLLVAALLVPALGSRYYTFVATDVVILALFAVSLNVLLGYTGLVSFGHAAYFGIGAYTTGILMKQLALPFVVAWPAAGLLAGAFAAVFGFFCVRLTKIYFAMLTLAFAQIVWAICFKWNDVTGGEQGMPDVPYPDLAWMERLRRFAEDRLAFEEPLILAGDYNVIPEPFDCHDPRVWEGDALFLPKTRAAFRKLENLGFTDAARATTDEAGLYSFWDYQAGAWPKNNGIRIDHLMLSAEAADRLESVSIEKHVRAWEKPSDHVPVCGYFDFSPAG